MAFALRPDAVQALEDARLDAFLARAKAHAAHHFPDVAEDLGDAGLDRMARLAIGRGNLYGLGGERHVLQLLNLMLLVGEHFDISLPESAQVQGLLGDAALDADMRLDRVNALLAPHWGGPKAPGG